jgi:hypothetical protein
MFPAGRRLKVSKTDSHSIPLELATLDDIATELHSRNSTRPYLFIRWDEPGYWVASANDIDPSQCRELLEVMQVAARAAEESGDGPFLGRGKDFYFEGNHQKAGWARRFWKTIPGPVREAFWFVAACATISAMLRWMR